MKIKLEKYIEENRESLDNLKAPSNIWNNIASDLEANDSHHKKKSNTRPWLYFISGIAASLLVVSMVGIGYYYGQNSSPDFVNVKNVAQYEKIEKYYLQEIGAKMDLIKDNDIDHTVGYDLKQLDLIYDELKVELLENENGNSAEIIQAMIKNYETKLDLLELIKRKQANVIKKRSDAHIEI